MIDEIPTRQQRQEMMEKRAAISTDIALFVLSDISISAMKEAASQYLSDENAEPREHGHAAQLLIALQGLAQDEKEAFQLWQHGSIESLAYTMMRYYHHLWCANVEYTRLTGLVLY